MALSDAYATVDEYFASVRENQTAPESDEALYLEVLADLKAVARIIDHRVGRPMGFNRDSADSPVARIYDVPATGRYSDGWQEAENPWKATGAKRVLNIDDHASISSIVIDERRDNTFATTLSASDYELLPRNATSRPEAVPYTQILLTEWGTQWAWPPGAKVRVTGCAGWPAVPPAIKSANIQLTAILRIESPRATNRVQEMNAVLTMSRAAQSILHDLVATYAHAGAFV